MNLVLFSLFFLLQGDLGLPQPGAKQAVAPLAFDAKELARAFNAAADRARVVLVLSPT